MPKSFVELLKIDGFKASYWPELIHVVLEAKGKKPELYSVSRVSAHTNVEFLFDEKDRRDPAKDRLIIKKGLLGSYPNLIYIGKKSMFANMVAELAKAPTQAHANTAFAKFALTRDRPDFWPLYDAYVEAIRVNIPSVAFGLPDLREYVNIRQIRH